MNPWKVETSFRHFDHEKTLFNLTLIHFCKISLPCLKASSFQIILLICQKTTVNFVKIQIRLKSTFGPLSLGLFSFWPPHVESSRSDSLRLFMFQKSPSVQICYQASVKCQLNHPTQQLLLLFNPINIF